MSTHTHRLRPRTELVDAYRRPGIDDEPPDVRTGEREPDGPEPADDSDLDDQEMPCTDDDDARWEAFIPDDDECDPEPDPGDFWIEHHQEARVASQDGESRQTQ